VKLVAVVLLVAVVVVLLAGCELLFPPLRD
jgi:hypothetical protein